MELEYMVLTYLWMAETYNANVILVTELRFALMSSFKYIAIPM